MALTTALGTRTVPGASFSVPATLTCDTSYPAGGYILTASTFGLTVLKRVLFNVFTTVAGAAFELALVPTYASDGATLLSVAVRLVVGTSGVEVATGANISSVAFQVIADGN